MQRPGVDRIGHHSSLRHTRQNAADDIRAGALFGVDLHRRMRCHPGGELARQKSRHRRGVGEQPQRPLLTAGEGAHRLAQTLLLRKKRACMARQYLPGLSQRHAASMTLQQGNTDLCLQLAHSFAGGGQGEMGHGGPTGNTAAIHDGDKQSQIGQIHPHHTLPTLRFSRSLRATYRIVALATSGFNVPFYPEK
ncbi:putative uncharacterized protein [Klebsiella variicola CAG:634]|nr:putative uncharacterized protein [Klebsiella variicola CAG:634]